MIQFPIIIHFLISICLLLNQVRALTNDIANGDVVELVPNTVEGIATCYTTLPYTDPVLGTFNRSKPFCDTCVLRLGPLCCVPQKPDITPAIFTLSTRKVSNIMLENYGENVKGQLAPGMVHFIVHGFGESPTDSSWINQTRDALLADSDCTVIVTNWYKKDSGVWYFASISNLRVVGAQLGAIAVKLDIIDRSNCIGFSLGGQTCASMASWVKWDTKRRTGVEKKVKKCTGLDPAGPSFDGCGKEVKLSRDDCETVVVVHTNANAVSGTVDDLTSFGTGNKSGHCDFWPNGGYLQLGCPDVLPKVEEAVTTTKNLDTKIIDLLTLTAACPHNRAHEYFISQTTKKCNFIGTGCSKCGKGIAVIATGDQPEKKMRMPPFDNCNSNMDDNYFFTTGPLPPYCPI